MNKIKVQVLRSLQGFIRRIIDSLPVEVVKKVSQTINQSINK